MSDDLLYVDRWPNGQPDWAASYTLGRELDDREWLVLAPLTFGRVRLAVMTAGNACIEDWHYDGLNDAVLAWLLWPAPPLHWTRHQRRDGVKEWPDGRTEP